ncbi:hypothetical protein ACFE04_028523 [Oxalis oulophora]
MMITFCNNKKSVHSFLGLNLNISIDSPITSPCHSVLSPTPFLGGADGGLRLISTLPLSPPPSPSSFGWYGLGGGVDGLNMENKRRVDDEVELSESVGYPKNLSTDRIMGYNKWRKTEGKGETKKFPPPLTSLDQNGQPNFFLRPVRKNGRLELTEVKIDRPEILRAYREDGRLKLHIIRNDRFEEKDEDIIEGQQVQELVKPELIEEKNISVPVSVQSLSSSDIEKEDEKEKIQQGEEQKNNFVGWRLLWLTGEGFRWCHELLSPRYHPCKHHTNFHVQQFVAT